MKQALSDRQLEAFRRQLEEKRAKAQEQLVRFEQEELPRLNQGEEANDTYGDDAKYSQERSRMIELINVLRRQVEDYEAALLRIENKTFGIDKNTGEPIALERLKAEPTAETNI